MLTLKPHHCFLFSFQVIDPDTELNNELCDEVCAELQYLQWKLAQTMGINELKTMPLVRQYKKSHHHEMELDERSQSHRESIDELSAQVLAVQDFKAKELLKKDQEERQKLAKVREREDAFVVLLHSLYCCARCTAALVVLTRFRHDSPTELVTRSGNSKKWRKRIVLERKEKSVEN